MGIGILSIIPGNNEIVFFLGAGASVAAGVPETFGMVDSFKERISSQPGNLHALNKIVDILKRNDEHGKVDIELLLETIERLDNRDKDILLKFFNITNYVLEGYVDKKPLKEELKDFIKESGIVEGSKIRYLEPLLGFIAENRPLDVFSVNYDVCIEQFCNVYKKEYVDGFDIGWNPKLFERTDVDIRLFKLHGSVMWYRTDRGDYVKLPIRSHNAETRLITGEKAESLILYPMRKWEYAEPLLELLIDLKRKLEKAKFVFVIGYSFRDEHIRRIFWDSSRKNKELVVFLISPNSDEIYSNRLRDYEIPGISHAFSSNFEYEKFDAAAPSELARRVICLPYKFENMFPLLKNHFLKKLKEGLVRESDLLNRENKGEIVEWWSCLKPFAECEYMGKFNEILSRVDWNEFSKNRELALEVSFIATLNCLSHQNIVEAEGWFKKFMDCFNIYRVENIRVETRSQPESIYLGFTLTESSYVGAYQSIGTIQRLYEISKLKVLLFDENKNQKIEEIRYKIEQFYNYLLLWKVGGVLLTDYIGFRELKYSRLIEELKKEYEKYKTQYSQEQHTKVNKILKEIETEELRGIFGGSVLTVELVS